MIGVPASLERSRRWKRNLAAMFLGSACLLGCTGNDTNGSAASGDAAGDSQQTTTVTGEVQARVLQALRSASDGTEAAPSEPKNSQIRFRAVGAESGFEFQRNDDMRGQRRILEVNGGGAAVFDLDCDGWLDIFMTNGCRLPRVEDTGRTPGQLFRNRSHASGMIRFGECSDSSLLVQTGFCCGCAVADVDHDGFEDLYLTAIGGNQFWKNNGDGTFTEIASLNGTQCGVWGASAAFADLNGDSHPDLYVANYLDVSETSPLLCPEPRSPDGYVGCTPAMFQGVRDNLYLSDGSGGWIDASAAISSAVPFPGKALGVVITDLGGDRLPEIYVANDGQPNFLFTVAKRPGGEHDVAAVELTDRATSASAALNYEGFAQASMGIAAEDFNRDGLTDLFLTHFYRDTNTLYINQSSGDMTELLFEDRTRASRLGQPSMNLLGFGVCGLDADCDGWNDLLVVNGHVDDRTWFDAEQSYRMPAQMFANRRDGTFSEVSKEAGEWFETASLGRAAAAGDLDRDGLLDVVVSNQLDPSVVLRNESTPAGATIVLRLVGRTAGRTAVGARVQVLDVEPILVRQLASGTSYQAAEALELHFGGLEQREYRLRVEWPDGLTEEFGGVQPGQWLVRQGHGVYRRQW
ncbi:MAG: hypothetical protein RLZZ458_1330 [Planctomycetota bacterium]